MNANRRPVYSGEYRTITQIFPVTFRIMLLLNTEYIESKEKKFKSKFYLAIREIDKKNNWINH
jgi:hypothetical protein